MRWSCGEGVHGIILNEKKVLAERCTEDDKESKHI